MGKKKIVQLDDTQSTPEKKAKKEMFRWEQAYTDLKDKTADILRQARLKPEQLASMADGELLSLEGVGPAALEEIRSKYPATLAQTKPETQSKEAKEVKTKTKESTPKETKSTAQHPKTRHPRNTFGRSNIYKSQKTKLKVDIYPLSTAVKMLREVSYSVHKTVELHLNVKETGIRGEVSLPHSIGKETSVAIFTPELGDKIKSGKIDFDILLAKPADMPLIAPLARVLGPKGLMPNPKSNTIINDPEKRKQELEAGALLTYRTEAKAPIIHLSVGNLDQKDKELTENIETIINAIGISKITSAYIKSTMSPSLKISLSSL